MTVEARYRRFLLATALVIYVGAAVELWLVEHVEGVYQWVPFGLAAIGAASALAFRASASRRTGGVLRASSAVVVAGSVWGVVLHVRGNLAFEREVHPDAPLWGALREAAGGVSPLLAPGTLALAAVLAAAATYRHPALSDRARQPA